MPKVSVIVPNYNHAPYLKQRIDSILNQTYQDFELILLDDCSTDNSREILESYKNHSKVSHLVYNETNSGTAFRQWNKGIGLAQGDWIWIAESDDWADTGFLEKTMTEAARYPDCGLIYTLARYMTSKGEAWPIKETGLTIWHNGMDFVYHKLLYYNSIYNVSMLVFQKGIFEQIDQSKYANMKLCGDWFFYIQLCEHTNVLEIQKAYSNYRMHNTNTSSWTEREGMTFMEGVSILDYITEKYSIKPSVYSFLWAKEWIKHQKRYHYSKDVFIKIKQRICVNHKLIYFYYILISFVRWIKGK